MSLLYKRLSDRGAFELCFTLVFELFGDKTWYFLHYIGIFAKKCCISCVFFLCFDFFGSKMFKKHLTSLKKNEKVVFFIRRMHRSTSDPPSIARDILGEQENSPKVALASEIDRAIDLSCRACGAMAMGAGLGFPVGVSAPLRFPPPTSDF